MIYFTHLRKDGYKLNDTYIPLIENEQIQAEETPEEFVRRMQQFYVDIIQNFTGSCAIIVSNITGIYVLADGTASFYWDLHKPHSYMKNCHVHVIKILPDGKVSNHFIFFIVPIKEPILPFTRTLYDAEVG
ncbi:unnamed protein product [Thelazia callipaeda]|uniref:AraC family transcriptional regulator n=1 Tax=Thelazia callipaeda TaxID=103827 RepID=A0A0N5CQZ5_THECL|nr:unnamed protein product [Thelazia callipaeda]